MQRRLSTRCREFSEAAGLPEQRERMRVLYSENLQEALKKYRKMVQ